MRRILSYAVAVLLGVLAASPAPQGAWAQEARAPSRSVSVGAASHPVGYTLRIQDGQVYLNGEALDEATLPDDLDLQGLEANFSFTGLENPIIELNGRFFMLDQRSLHEIDNWREDDGRVTVFFREKRGDAPLLKRYEADDPSLMFFSVAADEEYVAEVQQQMAQVLVQAQELQDLSRRRTQTSPEELSQIVDQLQRQAQRAANTAEALPQIEAQRYLSSVQQQDRALYERLLTESQREQETHQLAARIRRMPEGEERMTLVAELRQKLDDIFELKQDNRRREIAQLEAQLDQLRGRLEERERLRHLIIDRRLKDLVGTTNESNW